MKDVVKFSLLGERRLEFTDDAVTHVAIEHYPIPLPGLFGACSVTTNTPLYYDDIRWVGTVRRKQWWALFSGAFFAAIGLWGLFGTLTGEERWDSGLLWFLVALCLTVVILLGVLPLRAFCAGRPFLAIATNDSAIAIPADRKRGAILQAIDLLKSRLRHRPVKWAIEGELPMQSV